MLTKEQKKWIEHLSDKKKIKIIPYDPKVKIVFSRTKKEIQQVLGKINVMHCGSTNLEIFGQGEIDLYIPVNNKSFNSYLKKLIKYFGEAGTVHSMERARFVKYVDKIKVEIFLINEESDGWKNGLEFESYLKRHPDILGKYEKLKKKCNRFSIRKYITSYDK